MKLKRLGKEWGSAWQEAEPVEISHGDLKLTIFVGEEHQLYIELPPNIKVSTTTSETILVEVEA